MALHYYRILSEDMIFLHIEEHWIIKWNFALVTDDLYDGSIENIILIFQKYLLRDVEKNSYEKMSEDRTVEDIIELNNMKKAKVTNFFH